jgi:hypothetical protein
VRGLEEEGNPAHRVRVEHNRDTLLIHLSGEEGPGWTVVAIDRRTRAWSIAQRPTQRQAAEAACGRLYVSQPQAEDERRARGKKAIVSR